MNKLQKIRKKILMLITAIAVLCAALPMEWIGMTASAASTVKRTITYYENYRRLTELQIGDGAVLHFADWAIITNSDTGEPLYCVEPGAALNSDVDKLTYTEGTWAKLTDEKIRLLGRIFLYSYTTGNPNSSTTTQQQYIATQMLVWEVMVGQRDEDFNKISNGYTPVSDLFKTGNLSNYTGIQTYYNQYEKSIKDHNKNVTCAYRTEAKANANIAQVNADGTYTFTDKNSQLGNYTVNVTNGSVVSKTNSQLKIKVDANKKAKVTFTQSNANAENERYGVVVLNYSGLQTLAGTKADPREYYAFVTGLDTGDLSIVKTSDDGVVDGFQFKITGPNGYSTQVTTKNGGKIDISNMEPGTYTVEEVNMPGRYNKQSAKTVTVTAGETASVSFKNVVQKGAVVVRKTSEDGNINNVTFTLRAYEYIPSDRSMTQIDIIQYDENGNQKVSAELKAATPESGIIIWSNLPLYTIHNKRIYYEIEETGKPARFVDVKPVGNFLDQGEMNLLDYSITNNLKHSEILIVKLDGESGEVIPAAGTGFEILDSSGNKVVMTDSDSNEVSTFYTDESGQIKLPEKLVYGMYQLVEVEAPEGYVLDIDPVDFAVTEDGVTVTVEKKNSPQKGTISVTKTGEAFTSVSSENGVYTPVFSEVKLAGAEFEIYAAEDIYTPDGTLRIAKGDLVDTITTGSDGIAESKELYLGTYQVIETKAPKGYITETGEQLVTIEYAGQNVSVTNTSASFSNNYQGVKISLEKYFEQSEIYGIGSNDEYLNAAFGLFAAENITAADGTVIPKGGLIETAYLSEDMTTGFNTKLPFADYYVQETATDEHYILNDTKYPVSFAYSGQEEAVQEIAVNGGAAIENILKKGKINGLKSDADDGTGLEGAVIGIFSNSETEFTEENAYETVTSGKDGSFSFEDVVIGQYMIAEIKAPTGYVLTDTVYPVIVSEDGETISVEISNEKIRGSVKLEKASLINPSQKLSGAVFEVYSDTNGNGKFDNGTDKSYGYLNEIEMAIYQLDGVEYGEYFVKETKAPEGFVVDENYYYFEIRTQDEVVEISNDDSGKFLDDVIRGDVEGLKINADDKTALSGALIGLFSAGETEFTEKNALETVTSGKDCSFAFRDIIYGKYVVAEIKAPTGYVLSDKVHPVNISVDGMIIEITIENKPIKGNVMVVKYGFEHPEELLKGAVFAVYEDTNSDKKYSNGDKLVGNLTETAGIHEYNNLLYGDYLLKEIKAPEGYIADNSYYPFSIRNDGETIKISNNGDGNFYNTMIKGNIEGIKVGESDEPLSGAVIGLFADGESEFTEENALKTVETGKDGKFAFKDVEYGKYVVAEIKAPVGYILTEDTFPVNIDEDGETISVEISNEKIRGRIEGVKVGESDEPLSGAVIGLFADGESKFTEENALKTDVTDENGKFSFEEVEYGKYKVAEVKAPSGYVLSSETFPVNIDENGKTISVEISNEKIRGRIEGIKVGESDEPLSGALIGLFADGESEFTEKNALKTVETDKDGKFEFDVVEYGKYIVAEIHSPEGYILTEETFPVNIDEDGETISVEISNEKIRGRIEGVKVGESDEPLSGAVIGLFADDESELTEENALKTDVTDENGKFSFEEVEYGKYKVAEVKAPSGYVLSSETFPVSIDENGETITVEIGNEKIRGSVRIEKYDEHTDEKLSGAVFEVYSDKNSNQIYDADEKTVGTLTETEKGIYQLDNIEYGDYLLKEIKAPDGYQADENYYSFAIRNNGETVKISNNESGDKFYNVTTTIVTTTVTTTTTTVTTSVTTTTAPETTPGTTVTTTATTPGTTVTTVPNTTVTIPAVPSAPKTGDKLPIAIFVVGVAALAGMIVTSKKKKKTETFWGDDID